MWGTGLDDFHTAAHRMAEDHVSWRPGVANYGHAHSIYFDPRANGGLLLGLFATFGLSEAP